LPFGSLICEMRCHSSLVSSTDLLCFIDLITQLYSDRWKKQIHLHITFPIYFRRLPKTSHTFLPIENTNNRQCRSGIDFVSWKIGWSNRSCHSPVRGRATVKISSNTKGFGK
jgi:hypothetical protein